MPSYKFSSLLAYWFCAALLVLASLFLLPQVEAGRYRGPPLVGCFGLLSLLAWCLDIQGLKDLEMVGQY